MQLSCVLVNWFQKAQLQCDIMLPCIAATLALVLFAAIFCFLGAMGKKKRKKPSSGSAAQPADGAPKDSARKWRSSGSAEQPADDAPEGSAEQPVHPSVDDTSKLHASFGYLAFPAKDYTRPAARRQVVEAFKESRQSYLAVIHMAFAREGDLINVLNLDD